MGALDGQVGRAECTLMPRTRATLIPMSGTSQLSVHPRADAYDAGVDTERTSRTRRLASKVYDAGAGSRSPVLDGPWWLGALGLSVVTVLTFGNNPWKWLVLPIAAVLFWLPFCIRWSLAIWHSVDAFREGFRS